MNPSRTRRSLPSRRAAKVCARCRKRKTKCDLKLPRCSSCQAAGACCSGYDPVAKTEVPRSLVRHLEDQIGQLEAQLQDFQQQPSILSSNYSSSIARSILSIAIPSPRSFFYASTYTSLVLRPSCPPFSIARIILDRRKLSPASDIDHSPSRANLRQYQPSQTNLKFIPATAIESMMRNYTDIHLPQYPIIDANWLASILTRILEERSGDTEEVLTYGISPKSNLTHFDYFAVFMSLSISSLTLIWRSEPKAIASSEAFCLSALKHLQSIQHMDHIQALQASLLLAHYAHMDPEKADNWTCIANAVRIVLDLGLHKGSKEIKDQEQRRVYQRLFWVTYGMDRSLCGLLRLPLSFPEESISTELCSISDTDMSISNVRKQASASHLYIYRRLETEVHRTLHLRDLAESQDCDLSSWIQSIHERLDAWYENSKKFATYQMLEFRGVQLNHLRAKLHRPTPKLPVRNEEDRRICLDACRNLVEEYQRQADHARLFYPWHGAHILFEAAVIMLDVCWSSRSYEFDTFPPNDTLSKTLPGCLALLEKIGERWKHSSTCAEYLKSILQEVRQSVTQHRTGNVTDAMLKEELVTTEKLRLLLFPDIPISYTLAWNA